VGSDRSAGRRILTVVVVLVVGVLVVGSLLWGLQRRLVFLPQGAPSGSAAEWLPGGRDVVLRTGDGLELEAWYVSARPGRATVLVAPGNAGHRGLRAPLAAELTRRGLGVLLLEYRGYAGNPGSPSEEGLALDARAARDFLVEEAGVDERSLIYLGESLGAAVVVALAAEHPPAGLVLRSPFTSLVDVGRVHYPFLPLGRLLRDRFDVVGTIVRVDVPTAVVLGEGDRIVPPAQSRAVAQAAGGPTTLVEVPGADHNDAVLLIGEELVGAVLEVEAAALGPG
jgi:hypothetical protein